MKRGLRFENQEKKLRPGMPMIPVDVVVCAEDIMRGLIIAQTFCFIMI